MKVFSLSNQALLGQLLRFPLRLIPSRTVMPILRGKNRGMKWIVGSCTHGCWLGNYEYDKRILFEKKVPRNAVVFDIGANVGYYTLLASVLVGPQGKVIAFEPVPGNLEYLNKHLQLNKIQNVTVIDKAVSNETGTASFDETPGSTTGRLASSGTLQVETVTIDDLLAHHGFPQPTVIKMDIEGGELLCLKGAKHTLEQHHPALFLATHGYHIKEQCLQFLRELKYHIQPVDAKTLETAEEFFAEKGV